jgi:hypothetical protein
MADNVSPKSNREVRNVNGRGNFAPRAAGRLLNLGQVLELVEWSGNTFYDRARRAIAAGQLHPVLSNGDSGRTLYPDWEIRALIANPQNGGPGGHDKATKYRFGRVQRSEYFRDADARRAA